MAAVVLVAGVVEVMRGAVVVGVTVVVVMMRVLVTRWLCNCKPWACSCFSHHEFRRMGEVRLCMELSNSALPCSGN